ncbi:TIM-barrel domain-containing protein [Telmatospirillum sp.]|uniref:TIM-barrel domain-containing protein n=1 Tax=Telmatospirillum sp. TaxID=2079197 RepID=UPI00283D038F|nr:TIM-barrel domain-containing protein [Telmatospirillum sp.]MDR3436943.1 glycoside hydrolase family 31 protein [Telmatospirillum sp.]
MDSSQSSYRFVRTDEFTPNSANGWVSFGPVSLCRPAATGRTFTITGVSPGDGFAAPVLQLILLGPKAFRLRFNPKGDYTHDGSYAVVDTDLGAFSPTVERNDPTGLVLDLGGITLDVLFAPFTLRVFLGGQLISSDTDRGIVYLPGNVTGREAVACFKQSPAEAYYFGFGEKGGPNLPMNGTSLTFFNYDNYKYDGANSGPTAVVPGDTAPGPLNPNEPLYNSIPFLIEDNPRPLDGNGQPTGTPYAYGLLFDNEAQTYFNIGASSASAGDMSGLYYFGALYGEIDYYFLAGSDVAEVLGQFKTLVGPPAMPPMWALGYHQGCYGYFNQDKVLGAVQAYRRAAIPLDGIHIDVDFQNNYRTFTASPEKFPGGGAPTFAALAAQGVKASTNITGIVTIQPLDESGQSSPYDVLDSGKAIGAFIADVRAEDPTAPPAGLFVTNESYGCNYGSNPYPSPGAPYDPSCGGTPLGTYGYYADLGRPEIRAWWGGLYKPLLDAGLEMVWQDMTDPATQRSVSDTMPWKTLALNLMMYDWTAGGMVPAAHIHNVFALNLIAATYDGLVKLRQDSGVDKRPFIIARGGYTGVHRYAASWTGDSASDWNFLSILIPEILNFGLSGQSMAGADVGGFALSSAGGYANGTLSPSYVANGAVVGGITDPELLVRWTTMSAFFGWFRNHYDGYNKQFQEPYGYAEPVPSICRKYIGIRYKLLQLFYDQMYEAAQTGLPICRPMFLNDGADLSTYQHLDDQFMVGHDLLVAPVVNRGQVSRDVYLPAGSDWYAYADTVAPLQGPSPGGQSINWYVPLDLVPLYVRAGAIIPRRELEQFVGQLPVNPISIDIYPGPDSLHILYLDDKIGMTAQSAGAYRTVQISQSVRITDRRVQTVRLQRLHDQFTPVEDFYFIGFLDSPAPLSVSIAGVAVPILQAATDDAAAALLAASAVNAAYYNQSLRTTFVKLFDQASDMSVVGTFPPRG